MRQKLPKILTAIFIIIFIFQLIGLIVLFVIPQPTGAQEPKLQVPISGFSGFKPAQESGGYLTINWIGEYINAIYKYAIGIVGILAAVVLMIGGVIWITAGGNQTRVGEAKAWIGASLTGLVLALGSFLILQTVNPKLVEINPISVKKVDKLENNDSGGCCEWPDGNPTTSSKEYCEKGSGGVKGTFYPNSYPDLLKCVQYATNDQACGESKKCAPGLKCINLATTIISSNDYKCTDGKNGSPCHVIGDCACSIATCKDNKCVCIQK